MTLTTCPKCAGTTRRAIPEHAQPYKKVMATYDAKTDTFACDNCGGQTMSLAATGFTRPDPATGMGCLHAYVGTAAGRCYTRFACAKCGDTYSIDSGD